MAVSMYHQNEIAQALRNVVQGATALTSVTEGSDRVFVNSTRLFGEGTAVQLLDADGQHEEHTVMECISGTEVRLESEVVGEFGPLRQARLQIGSGAGAELKWVAQGAPEIMPLPRPLQLPAAIVAPVSLTQPPNAGTNRTYQQEYLLRVYYFRQAEAGEAADEVLSGKVGELFNLIMSDPYLEETCWHAQVVRVELQGDVAAGLRSKNPGLQAAVLDVLARRAEVWTGV